MARPIYENENDVANEMKIATAFANGKVKVVKLPKLREQDIIFVNDEETVVGLAEIKCRNYNWGDFPTYKISMDKFMALRMCQTWTTIPVYLLVGWKCGTIAYLNGEVPGRAVIWGRTDRGDDQDIEIAMEIKNEHFKIHPNKWK